MGEIQRNKVLALTGGSAGIGRQTALLFAQSGYTVYELSRTGKSEKGVVHIHADVTDTRSIEEAIAQIGGLTDGVDALICNAGFGISGAVECTDDSEAKRQFDVNFFGAAQVISRALPLLRRRRGRIICVGSVAGVLPIPFQAYYSASKAALSAFCEALQGEIAAFGVDVCCLLPGDVKTDFTRSRVKQQSGEDLYGDRINRSVALMERDEQNGMQPAYIAHRLLRIASKKRVRPSYTAGFVYQLFVALAKLLPKSLVRRLVDGIYAK